MTIRDNNIVTTIPTAQQLRKSALQWQLAALDEQLGVLKTLDREHAFGLETTAEVTHIVGELRDLLKSAEALARDTKAVPQEQTLERIKTFHKTVQRIKGEADRFSGGAVLRARLRLQSALEEHKATAPDNCETPKPPADPEKLLVRASSCCFNAEASQYTAFAMQINAMCDLALEMIYNAAAEAGLKQG